MLAEYIALAVLAVMALAEWQHARRIGRVRYLAFGPRGSSAAWTLAVPFLNALAMTFVAWGLASLLWHVEARIHNRSTIDYRDIQHLILVVDVSPSMGLTDGGSDQKLTRRERASQVVDSIFERIPLSQFRVTFVAFYTDAKVLLEDSADHEVVRHMLESMPMWHAFHPGKTNLFAGLDMAAKIARPWNPGSTTVLVLTDGDTVPATGMPQIPASVRNVVLIGVGDPQNGRFIDGHLSRQDISTLRQVANRLKGHYHNGNDKQLPSNIVSLITQRDENQNAARWGRREYALAAVLVGSTILSTLPLLLHYFGTAFQGGTRIGLRSP